MISTCQSHLLATIRTAATALASESGGLMKSGSVLIAIIPQLGAREAPLSSSRIPLRPKSWGGEGLGGVCHWPEVTATAAAAAWCSQANLR